MSSLLVFSPVHLPPPFPVWISIGLYMLYSVWQGGGWGCVESIYRSNTLCIWPDSEPKKIPLPPQTKPRRGGGLRVWGSDTCRQVPLLFMKSRHLGSGVFIDIWSMGKSIILVRRGGREWWDGSNPWSGQASAPLLLPPGSHSLLTHEADSRSNYVQHRMFYSRFFLLWCTKGWRLGNRID
jgi:hypothetical protein